MLVLGLLGGCATRQPPPAEFMPQSLGASECMAWFRQIDDSVDRAGVRDASAFRVPKFPHLRSDRFLSSFRADVAENPRAFMTWVGRLRALDAEARALEMRNLPQSAFPLAGSSARQAAEQRTQACADILVKETVGAADARRMLTGSVVVPDDYTEWKRVAGLYWLTRIPFFRGVESWETKTALDFGKADSGRAQAGATVTYIPGAPQLPAARIAAIMKRVPKDPLGVPMPDAEDIAMLFRAYAPVFEVETNASSDRFGPLHWSDAPVPRVDITHPVAYQRLAFTRYRGLTLMQLVYTVWFPERPRTGVFDLLGGLLDGVTLRVTLAPDGTPLVYDTMHPCGCYHMFFATSLARARPAPSVLTEWAFTPKSLPAIRAGQRIVLRIESSTHYVVGVRTSMGEAGTQYRLADDNELRSLPLPDGLRRSAFGPDGIIAGTQRNERFFYWPMGIDNPGAMRQWGRHATAFVGRRHFDDPDLLEKRFELDLDAPAFEAGALANINLLPPH